MNGEKMVKWKQERMKDGKYENGSAYNKNITYKIITRKPEFQSCYILLSLGKPKKKKLEHSEA